MQHKVKVTVIDKKISPDLQGHYCANPQAGVCSVYQVGDEDIPEDVLRRAVEKTGSYRLQKVE